MLKITALKKGIFISLMSLSLLFGFSSVSLADEKAGSMGGMNMGGSTTTQAAPAAKDAHDSQAMSSKPQSTDPSSSMSSGGHEAMPGMEPNMEGMTKSSEQSGGHEAMPGMDSNMEGMSNSSEQSGGHGEASGGHGESSETSDGVNWMVVGGFLATNLLIIVIAGVLKLMKRTQSLV